MNQEVLLALIPIVVIFLFGIRIVRPTHRGLVERLGKFHGFSGPGFIWITTWGIEIVRAELKQIDPPKDVQETMNKIVKSENEKLSAVDYATAAGTVADGEKRASIKKAEGIRQARILQAEGEAEAIRLVNEAANKYFVGNAQQPTRSTVGGDFNGSARSRG